MFNVALSSSPVDLNNTKNNYISVGCMTMRRVAVITGSLPIFRSSKFIYNTWISEGSNLIIKLSEIF